MNLLTPVKSTWVWLWDTLTYAVPIPRHRLAAVISLIAWVIAVGATFWWLKSSNDPTAEPTSQVIIAATWLITSLIELFIPSDPGWEELHAKRAKADADILREVLTSLQAERLDFWQIRDKKGNYNSAAHRKAVEIQSFELLRPHIENLHTIRGYTSIASKVLDEIDRNLAMGNGRDVEKLLPLVDRLEAKIEKDLRRLERQYRGLA